MAKLERLSTREIQMVATTTLAAVNDTKLDFKTMKRKPYHKQCYLN